METNKLIKKLIKWAEKLEAKEKLDLANLLRIAAGQLKVAQVSREGNDITRVKEVEERLNLGQDSRIYRKNRD